MKIDSLNKSISEMSPDELNLFVKKIRLRRSIVKLKPFKKTLRPRKPKTTNPKILAKSFTKDQKLSLLEKLKGLSK